MSQVCFGRKIGLKRQGGHDVVIGEHPRLGVAEFRLDDGRLAGDRGTERARQIEQRLKQPAVKKPEPKE